MWYVLKLDYRSAEAAKTQTKMLGYSDLAEAQHIFGQLELSYQFNQPVRVKGGRAITASGVWLYESFKDHYAAAEAAVAAGEGMLMNTAKEINFEI
jgi:hypothetical protein